MSTRFYDTDLADAAWSWVAPVLPAARPGGRPRTTDLRAVLNAIFYLLRTGCQWRLLPRELPPWGTVYHYFQAWQNAGVWVHLHRVLYEQARRDAGRAAWSFVSVRRTTRLLEIRPCTAVDFEPLHSPKLILNMRRRHRDQADVLAESHRHQDVQEWSGDLDDSRVQLIDQVEINFVLR
jgi:putative transposase